MNERTIGYKLKHKRMELGLSLEEVSNKLKIREEILDSLENDNFDLGSHVYVKGYISSYSKYLGIDSASLIALYKRDVERIGDEKYKKKIQIIDEKEAGEDDSDSQPKGLDFKKNLIRLKDWVNFNIKLVGISLFLFVLTIIVILLISNTFKEPYLKLTYPIELSQGSGEFNIQADSIILKGETEEGSVITINNKPINLLQGFIFQSDEYPITTEKVIFNIQAISRLGIKKDLKLTINKQIKQIQPNLRMIVNVTKDDTNLVIKVDGNIKYDNKFTNGDSFIVNALKEINILTSDPNAVKLEINGKEFQLINENTTFAKNDNGEVVEE